MAETHGNRTVLCAFVCHLFFLLPFFCELNAEAKDALAGAQKCNEVLAPDDDGKLREARIKEATDKFKANKSCESGGRVDERKGSITVREPPKTPTTPGKPDPDLPTNGTPGDIKAAADKREAACKAAAKKFVEELEKRERTYERDNFKTEPGSKTTIRGTVIKDPEGYKTACPETKRERPTLIEMKDARDAGIYKPEHFQCVCDHDTPSAQKQIVREKAELAAAPGKTDLEKKAGLEELDRKARGENPNYVDHREAKAAVTDPGSKFTSTDPGTGAKIIDPQDNSPASQALRRAAEADQISRDLNAKRDTAFLSEADYQAKLKSAGVGDGVYYKKVGDQYMAMRYFCVASSCYGSWTKK